MARPALGRTLRRVVLGALLTVPAMLVVPAVVAQGPAACAAGASDGPHAGLVVDTGGGATTYCVALDGDTVNGLHLIALASAQYGLSYRLGFGGLAVCQLEGVGPDGDDCFAEYPDFWGYWHHTGDTGWSWASTGAGSAQIEDGDMDAWTWGSGDNGTSHPAPPALAFDDVCVPAPDPPPTTPPPPPKPTHPPTQPPSSGGATGGAQGTSSPPGTTAPTKSKTKAPTEEPSASEDVPTVAPSDAVTSAAASPAAAVAADPASGSGGGGGPWLGGLLALVAVAVFAVGGVLRLRAGRAGRGETPDP